jgi:hypothetical protein
MSKNHQTTIISSTGDALQTPPKLDFSRIFPASPDHGFFHALFLHNPTPIFQFIAFIH